MADIIGIDARGDSLMFIAGKYYRGGEKIVSPVNFQEYVRKIGGSSATDPSADSTNWVQQSGSGIKSIQRGVSSGSGSFTITVSAVNVSKSIVYFGGVASGSTSAATISLVDATTIAAATGTGTAFTVSWTLVEYY